MNIQFCKSPLGPDEIAAMTVVVESGWQAAGPETLAFEKEFSEYITPDGIDPYYCIYTNSGTSALKMAYKWYREESFKSKNPFQGIAPFITYRPNTFCATYSAAREMGLAAKPIEDGDTPNRNTHVSMHYGGVRSEDPCWLEDSAHRIEPKDPLVGKIRIHSFYVTKNMTTVCGGMFVTNDKEIYEKARLYWRDGLTSSTADRVQGGRDYEVSAMAGGYDGNDVFAAIGRVQLRRLPSFTARRNEITARYNKAFGQTWSGNHLYPYFVNSEEEIRPFRDYLREKGIATGYHYPGTGWLGVSLPIYPHMTDEEVEYIIKTIESKGA